jgi:ubiquinone/menaquinone biosynthesis C-methylase UbiE
VEHDEPDDDVDALLAAAYAVDGPDANRALDAAWAESYDRTFLDASGYVYHRRVAEIFRSGFASLDAPVLDVGCGTGAVGVALNAFGLSTIDGIDISAQMLGEARTKVGANGPVYRNLIEGDLTGPIELPSYLYAGIVSAGTFTHGHLGPGSLDELIRVAAPGGRCAIGINAAHLEELGFRDHLDECRDEGTINAYALTDVPIYANSDEHDLDQIARVAVFTVR